MYHMKPAVARPLEGSYMCKRIIIAIKGPVPAALIEPRQDGSAVSATSHRTVQIESTHGGDKLFKHLPEQYGFVIHGSIQAAFCAPFMQC